MPVLNEEKQLLTNSRKEVARRCAREEKLVYQDGYRPAVDPEELAFGTLVHKGLEALWRAIGAGLDEQERLRLAWAAMADERPDPFDLVKAEVMLASYIFVYSEDDLKNYEVLGVELEFQAPLINPETGAESRTWQQAGKLDVLLRDRRDGLVWFMEHKTSSEDVALGTNYWKRLRIDSQVSTYFAGAAAHGYGAAGCVYDVLGKPALRPSQVPVLDEHGNKIVLDANGERVRTAQHKWRQTGDTQQGYVLQTRAETPEEFRQRLVDAVRAEPTRYLVRGKVVRLEQELADAQADDWATARTLRDNQLAGRFPRNAKACQRFGRWCPFFDVCTGAASLEDPRLFKRIDNVHPELSNQEAVNDRNSAAVAIAG